MDALSTVCCFLSCPTGAHPLPRTDTAQGHIEACALTTLIDFRPHGLVSETPFSLSDQNHGISAVPTFSRFDAIT